MRKHTKVYLDFFNYGEQDFIPCEMECGDKAVDIHHLQSRHIKAESDPSFNMYCRIKHLENVCVQVYALIELDLRLKEYENRK